MIGSYTGLYQGTVTHTDDPGHAFRFRVRVIGVHAPDVSDDSCPLASILGAGSSPAGDYRPHQKNDVVLVMFINGQPDQPVIMGGFPAGGSTNVVSSPPSYLFESYSPDQYSRDRAVRRWQRVDGCGNTIELSENLDEAWVKLSSGASSVMVTHRGGQVVVEASGQVLIHSVGACLVEGSHVGVRANTVDLETTGQDLTLLDNGRINMIGTRRVHIGAYDDLTHQYGDVNIGGEVPRLTYDLPLPLSPTTLPRQSLNCNLRAKTVNLGVGTGVPVPLAVPSIIPVFIPGSVHDYETGIIPGVPIFSSKLAPTYFLTLRATLGIDVGSTGTMSLAALGPVTLASQATLGMLSGIGSTVASFGYVNVTAGTVSPPTPAPGMVNVVGAGVVNVISGTTANIAATTSVTITAPLIAITGAVTITGATNVIGVLSVNGTPLTVP